MFKIFRVSFLLLILILVAFATYRIELKHADWSSTKWVVIYPINADGSEVTENYINRLKDYKFEDIAEFMANQAKEYSVANTEPVKIILGPVIKEQPPGIPAQASMLDVVWWSLKVRFWASSIRKKYQGPPADIAMFIKYHDPGAYSVLPHSTAVAKLSLGLVNAFADRHMESINNVVIAHELLHVFKATDKYDLSNNLPIFPQGFAEPDKQPRYPQHMAEIMGGRIPVSASEAEMPSSLNAVLVGEKTAQEINWR